MASSKEYLKFILGQLSELEEITYRAMMGEFIIYYRGKIVGGIYDDRFCIQHARGFFPIIEQRNSRPSPQIPPLGHIDNP